jgi:hypothetical protein
VDGQDSIGLRAVDVSDLPSYVTPYLDVFSEEEASELPKHTQYDHAIDLEQGKEPPYRSIYRLSPKEQEVLWEYIFINLAKGWICKSKSPAEAPILFVLKKDSSL